MVLPRFGVPAWFRTAPSNDFTTVLAWFIPSYSVTQLLSYPVTLLPSYSVTQLLSYPITQLLSYSVTQLL